VSKLSFVVLFSFCTAGYLSTSLSRGTRWRSASLSSTLCNLSPLTIQDHSDSVESLVFALGGFAVVYSVRGTNNHRIVDDDFLSVPAGREPVWRKLACVWYVEVCMDSNVQSLQGIKDLLSLATDTLALVGFLLAQLADLGLFALAQLLNVYGGDRRLDSSEGLFGSIRV
jgi:hypothetical protein